MAQISGLPVYTIEAYAPIYYDTRLRLRKYKNIEAFHGDSRDFLQRLIHDPKIPRKGIFFYLDAHWNEDLPLAEEIRTIGRNWKDVVIMIDDFQVPDDGGYGFDDYGEGKRLSLDYIDDQLANWSVYFPAVKSSEETGLKRGAVLLSSPSLVETMDMVPSIRKHL